MRLWSLHPRLLDARGLVALWREGLLAQAVLRGETRGYRHHPQLARFRDAPHPKRAIAAYLAAVHAEATRRGYAFDRSKIGAVRGAVPRIVVTRGQLAFEWRHLRAKLLRRDPLWLKLIARQPKFVSHPSFRVVPGGTAPWERPGP